MERDIGKVLFRSESSGPKRLRKYGGIYVLGMFLGTYILNLIFSIRDHYYYGIIGSSLSLLPLSILILVYIIPEFKPFQPYLIIFQKVVQFRVAYLRILPITRILPKEEVANIEVNKEVHRFRTIDKLYIYVKDRKPFKMKIRWIENYQKALIYF